MALSVIPSSSRLLALSAAAQCRLISAVLVLAGFVAYSNSLDVPLILDDWATIQENPKIRQVQPLWEALRPPENTGVGGRPIANLSFVLNYALSGDSLRGYHAGNILIHLCGGLLLFGVVRHTLALPRWSSRFAAHAPLLAGAVAALWLLHPIQTQSVAYLSQRTESLMGLFYLGTLYAFLRGAQSSSFARLCWHALAIVSCACGMATKEGMVTVPALIALLDVLFVAGSVRNALRQRGLLYVGLASTWILLAFLMSGLRGRGVGLGLAADWPAYVLIECEAVCRYLWLSLWPANLIFDYGTDLHPGGIATVLSIGVLIALIALAIVGLRRRALWGFFVVWFLITLSPTSSVVPIPLQPISENRVYLPLVGVSAAVVALVYRLRPRSLLPFSAAAALAFVALTFARNSDYRTQVSIWADTVAKIPSSSRARNNYGQALQNIGRLAESHAEFEAAIQINPRYAGAYANLASSFGLLGQHDRAVTAAQRAVELEPTDAHASYNLGIALMHSGRLPEAAAALAAATQKRPTFAEAFAWHGHVMLELNRPADAMLLAEQALALKPSLLRPRLVQGEALIQTNRSAEALPHFETALQLAPNLIGAHNNLGLALWKLGRHAEAAAHFETALRLDPHFAPARANLTKLRERAQP